MRAICLAVAAAALASTGCAGLIATRGQDLAELKDRTEVHSVFGPPAAAGEDDGQPFEEFTTGRKISDPRYNGPGMAMVYGATFGLYDLVGVPYELYLTGRRTVQGQHLRFTYDADGLVIAVRFDGEQVLLPPRYSHDAAGEVTNR